MSEFGSVPECVFCNMVAGRAPCHKFWEDERHLAFLSNVPNTEGVSVVIPKEHFSSYVFDLPDEVRIELVRAASRVARILEAAYDDVGRCALIFEGYGVNHMHAKLFPLHGTPKGNWERLSKPQDKYFGQYEGYVSSHDGARVEDEVLAKLAARIRQDSVGILNEVI